MGKERGKGRNSERKKEGWAVRESERYRQVDVSYLSADDSGINQATNRNNLNSILMQIQLNYAAD